MHVTRDPTHASTPSALVLPQVVAKKRKRFTEEFPEEEEEEQPEEGALTMGVSELTGKWRNKDEEFFIPYTPGDRHAEDHYR